MSPRRWRRRAVWVLAIAAMIHCMWPTLQLHLLAGRVTGFVMGLMLLVRMLRWFRQAIEQAIDYLFNERSF